MTTSATEIPDAVFVWAASDDGPEQASPDAARTCWSAVGTNMAGASRASTDILFEDAADGLRVRVASPAHGVERIALRWNRAVAEDALILGDAWERSYGDLHWEHIRPERLLPWYWLASSAGSTTGAGVRVRPGALCAWTVDVDGITLWLDLRSGSGPVHLGERVLEAATLVSLDAADGSPFQAQRELCAALCSDPIRSGPLVGCNNWYYAYGWNFDADAIVRDANTVSTLSGDHEIRPFSVIDAGWSEGGSAPGGPWTTGTASFSNMARVAERIRNEGARPGLWCRPLLSRVEDETTRDDQLDGSWPMDPSRPETLARVAEDIRRFREWGYDLIKHDFSTFDVFGRFLPEPGSALASMPWGFADATRTTAEILVDFYRTIHDAASGAVIIGCNTIGHLAAGLVHAQRTGDDTSGREWERTRRMGVNTLAFRLAQHETFFTVDADCVPSTPETPWDKNRQFLDLVAQSGTALFVSVDPATRSASVDADLRAALAVALDGGNAAGVVPLDWQSTSAPRRWQIGADERQYSWSEPWGAQP